MITWRNVYSRNTWLKGRNDKKGNKHRTYQIIYKDTGWIFNGMPKDEPWELLSTGGGNPSILTTHKTRDEAMQFAENC